MDNSKFKFIAEEIRREVELQLTAGGLLCRVFGRGKSNYSLESKLEKGKDKYNINGKLIQDSIGIRVVLYFSDDIEVARSVISNKFRIRESDSTIDTPEGDEFSVTRYNLIYEIPENQEILMSREIGNQPIDRTFEVQIRSVLSEGWHEVEHDLRYKQKEYWIGSDDLSRALNGIVATLETSEWGMRKIFDDIAYRHYKQKNWGAMVLLKLRMRLSPELDSRLIDIINAEPEIGKKLLRINRALIIEKFATKTPKPPLTLSNAIYLWNIESLHNDAIYEITPKLLMPD